LLGHTYRYERGISMAEVSLLRRIAAKGVRLTHLLMIAFIMFGWAFPWPTAWMIHVVLTPLTRLHWRLNVRRCILTSWEVQLLGEELLAVHEEGWFLMEIVESVSNWRPPTKLTRQAMAVWMWAATAASAARIWLQYGV
jgi:hypothetical protein